MNLLLQRLFFTQRSTCGELFLDSMKSRFCYTLELPVKDGMPGSAIPPGTYKIEFAPSPKFEKSQDAWVQRFAARMPHIVDPAGKRTLIMFHWLNFPSETDGCVGVGYTHDLDTIGESRVAFEHLYPLLSDGDTLVVQGGIVQPADLSLEGDV